MPPLNMKTYYDEVAAMEAEGVEVIQSHALPHLLHANRSALDRLIDWGKERHNLTELMAAAQADNSNPQAALRSLTRMFPVKTSKRKVRVPKELMEQYAGKNSKEFTFGVQDISEPQDMELLEKNVAWAKKYFPNIAVYGVVDSRNGTQLALIMGIKVNEYNALMKAESRRQQLQLAVKQACKELNVPEAWVDQKIGSQGSGNADKSKEKSTQKMPKKSMGRAQG